MPRYHLLSPTRVHIPVAPGMDFKRKVNKVGVIVNKVGIIANIVEERFSI